MRAATLALSIGVVAMPGCYRSHARPRADDGHVALDAPAPRDGGADARAALDAPPPLDAPRCPEPPVPPGMIEPAEPEPDVMPDESPRGPWEDVAPPPFDAPALEPIGERFVLDDECDGGGTPSLAWNGRGWAASWPYGGPLGSARVATLAPDGRLLVGPVTIPEVHGGVALDFAVGRYALVSGDRVAATRDRELRPVVLDAPLGTPGIDVARYPIAHGWLVASRIDLGASIEASILDDTLRTTRHVVVGRGGTGDVRVASSLSRALVVWPTDAGVYGRILRGADLDAPTGPFEILSMRDAVVEIAPFRDSVVVVAAGGFAEIRARLIEPHTDRGVHAVPVNVAVARTGARPSIAVAPELGFYVVCWQTGSPSLGAGVALQVVGADGTLWGRPLQLVDDEPLVGGLACGWNGADVVVVWWRASGDGLYNTMFAERAHPTFL